MGMVVIDASFAPLIFGIIGGSGAGALSAFLGYIKQNQTFDRKLFVYGIVTGIIAGMTTAMIYATDLEAAQTATALTKVIFTIVVTVLAADTVRTALTGAIRGEPTTTTTPPS